MDQVVIIEGNPLFRQALESVFDFRSPFVEVVSMGNGQKALELLETLSPALVFIDVRLPNENGLELTSKIKSLHPDATVIIVSSHDSPEYRQAARLSGGDYLILKESPLEDYFGLIDSILSERELRQKGLQQEKSEEPG